MSFYQEYRPKTFDEVIGQDTVKTFLQNIIKKDREGESIPHAYIFHGGHGIGKTTLARIFARELGTNESDIYEMDAAANNGIDEIRSLKESIYLLPIYSKYKIYILDEAHGLSKAANNAILKILEEPPKHVIFIFCTTELHKMLDTVISRCQTLKLDTADRENIIKLIKKISQKTKIDISDESLDFITQNANKSFRDAINKFEYLEKYLGNVPIELKTISNNNELSLIKNLINRDAQKIIKNISSDINVDHTYKDILSTLSEGMMIRNGIDEIDNQELKNLVKNNAAFFTSANILYFLEKERIFYDAKDKKIALTAILCGFIKKDKS